MIQHVRYYNETNEDEEVFYPNISEDDDEISLDDNEISAVIQDEEKLPRVIKGFRYGKDSEEDPSPYVSGDEHIIARYMRDIKAIPLLSPEEEMNRGKEIQRTRDTCVWIHTEISMAKQKIKALEKQEADTDAKSDRERAILILVKFFVCLLLKKLIVKQETAVYPSNSGLRN
jgi:hypothetical protein